jgi:hypothetical protein
MVDGTREEALKYAPKETRSLGKICFFKEKVSAYITKLARSFIIVLTIKKFVYVFFFNMNSSYMRYILKYCGYINISDV